MFDLRMALFWFDFSIHGSQSVTAFFLHRRRGTNFFDAIDRWLFLALPDVLNLCGASCQVSNLGRGEGMMSISVSFERFLWFIGSCDIYLHKFWSQKCKNCMQDSDHKPLNCTQKCCRPVRKECRMQENQWGLG